jgi:hypothetical protein
VIREPDRAAASITITPADRPLTMRLRRGNARAIGGVPRVFPFHMEAYPAFRM